MLIDDLLKAKCKIEKRSNHNYMSNYNDTFLKLYYTSNENLAGYLKDYNYAQKSVLTTGSSCDQIFDLISYGSRKIDHIDINPFVKYYYYLKKVGIEKLSLSEFCDFFHFKGYINDPKLLNDEVYYNLSKDLPVDAKFFWDGLYEDYTPNQIKDKLFFHEGLNTKSLIVNNNYLHENNYKLLRKQISSSSINFINKNIIDIINMDLKYDYVILSNIFDYLFNLKSYYDKEELMENYYLYKLFLNKLDNVLNCDGIVFFHYFFGTKYNDTLTDIRKIFKNNSNIQEIIFPSSDGNIVNCNDSVMTYVKR